MRNQSAWGILAAASVVALAPGTAEAVENATGIYLLGSKGPLAGITPPPGVYFQNDIYIYSGSASKNLAIPDGNNVLLGLDTLAVLGAPTLLWIAPANVLGGRFGAGFVMPFGYEDLTATLGKLSIDNNATKFGDPLVTALLGWDAGNFHIQATTLVNVPIGPYNPNDTINLAFHRWAADFSTSATWLDPHIGLDLSGTVGFTLNGTNPETDYTSGNEFHFEWAADQHFNKQFDAGLVGYYYQQVSADSGSGAVLGSFEGRVAAIGATLGYNFNIGALPISTRIKYYHEFDVKNRVQGDAVWLTASLPL